MAKINKEMIARILTHVGGAGNVAQAGNCMTRLRLTLRPGMTATATIATGPARVLALTDLAQPAGDRMAHFVHASLNAASDLAGPQNTKVRITMIHAPSGLVIHCRSGCTTSQPASGAA